MIFCFQKKCPSRFESVMLNEMENVLENPAGTQLSPLFQTEGLQRISMDDLAGILPLSAKHQEAVLKTWFTRPWPVKGPATMLRLL